MQAAAMLGATLAEWQKRREEEAAHLATLRNSGGGEEGDSDAADKKRMKVLARVNPAYASALAKEQSTRAAIAKVTAQEQKAWTRENTLKVEATQAYKESENKGQYLKQELQNIRVEEAEYRAEEKAKEQALQDYRTGEKNAVAIAEEYAIEAQRIGERNAVAIAEDYEERMREQALQTQRLGEQYAVEIAEDYEVREREWLNAVDAVRWAGTAQIAQIKQSAQPSKWEQTISWIDKHQPIAAMGVGGLVALAAIAIVVLISAPISLSLIAATAIASAATAMGLVTAGTMALNSHYDRPLTTNIVSNVLWGGGTALVVSSLVLGGLLFCATPTGVPICGAVPPVLDTVEQVSLQIQLAYETAIGDPHAGETAIELQLELNDGGVPGNSVAPEVSEQLAKLGDDVPELLAIYGDEIIPLLIKYEDNAVDIIKRYGNGGIEVLLKRGNNPNSILLIKKFEEPAVKLLKTMDVTSASKLLDNLEPDVLEYAMEQGPDALSALSRWKPAELDEFGMELALRSKKDAQVLEDIRKLISLGKLDPKNPTHEQMELIHSIAEDSIQYSENGQIVLGKWVDYGNGFTQVARETGSAHYNPHPDMWELFGAFGDANREEAAWLVNQQVIQIGVDRGIPFEYTLEGVPKDKIELDESAIEIIWRSEKNRDVIYTSIKDDLGINVVPVRVRELVELYLAGYSYSSDILSNSYVFIK